MTCILLTIILKLSRRLNCLVLPSSVISSGTAKLTTSWRKLIKKMFMLRKLKAAGLNSQELLIVYKGYIRPLLEYAAPCDTQVSLNNRLTRLRTFRSECANTSLVGTTNPTPNLLQHWRWKPYMTGVSIFAGILLARYLLLIDSQLGLLPLFRIPSCNSEKVMSSNHSGTRLSGSNLAPSHTWPTCSIHDLF